MSRATRAISIALVALVAVLPVARAAECARMMAASHMPAGHGPMRRQATDCCMSASCCAPWLPDAPVQHADAPVEQAIATVAPPGVTAPHTQRTHLRLPPSHAPPFHS